MEQGGTQKQIGMTPLYHWKIKSWLPGRSMMIRRLLKFLSGGIRKKHMPSLTICVPGIAKKPKNLPKRPFYVLFGV
jgi:hypothetical protein